MPFSVSVLQVPAHVRYHVTGPASLDRFRELTQRIAADTAPNALLVLVDLRGVDGKLSFTEQLMLGELAATRLSHLGKLASVVRPEELTHNSEKVAVRAGMRLRSFSSETEALAWLAEGEAA